MVVRKFVQANECRQERHNIVERTGDNIWTASESESERNMLQAARAVDKVKTNAAVRIGTEDVQEESENELVAGFSLVACLRKQS
eukprot:2589723-Amphidinium_carterae.1